MVEKVFQGIMIPFLGTAVGASGVFFIKKKMNAAMQGALIGFAAGIMVATSVWSLLIPAFEQAEDMGRWSFLPAVIGFWIGTLALLLLDRLIPYLHENMKMAHERNCKLQKSTMLVLAVVLHNIPEGMAVGVVYAGWLSGRTPIMLSGALALSVGIAIQNLPEGAIISMPLCAKGMSKPKSFVCGVLSGIVEPIGALLTICAAGIFVPALPYLLGLAAGAMFYVVIKELIPEVTEGNCANIGTVMFAVGFSMMMALDVAFG